MRITCPNCNAHYKIAEDLIPSGGREVQCSNCGTTWFQGRRAGTASAAGDRATRHPGGVVAGEAPPEDGHIADAGAEAEEGRAPEPPPAEPRPEPRLDRRPAADDRALAILHEERAREERLRAQAQMPPSAPRELDPREAAAAERDRMAAAAKLARAREGARPDPRGPAPTVGAGLDDGDDDGDDDDVSDPPMTEAESEARDDMSDAIAATLRDAVAADVRPEPVRPPARAAAGTQRRSERRQLLPDIEEINSSLRPDERGATDDDDASASDAVPRSRTGFRLGFFGCCLVVLGLVALYVFAEPIARAVPALTDALVGYVEWINARRLELADAVEALTARIAPDT